jgi:hypothetical protein
MNWRFLKLTIFHFKFVFKGSFTLANFAAKTHAIVTVVLLALTPIVRPIK